VAARLFSAAVCALGAHALLYGSFHPHDRTHGYLGWYEPAVAAAALAVLLVTRPSWLRTRDPIAETARRFATTAFAIVVLQESAEQSLARHTPTFVAMTPSQWLVLVVAVAVTALLLAFALRAGQVVVALLRRPRTVWTRVAARWSVVAVRRAPARPLSAGFALRAPPAIAA
jgi:hypothetical protein